MPACRAHSTATEMVKILLRACPAAAAIPDAADGQLPLPFAMLR